MCICVWYFLCIVTVILNGSVKCKKDDGVKEVQWKEGKNPVAIIRIYDSVMFLWMRDKGITNWANTILEGNITTKVD